MNRKCQFQKMPRHILPLPTRKTHRAGTVTEVSSSTPLSPKRTRGRLFILLGTGTWLFTNTYNLVLCFWNYCIQRLHHARGKQCSCCLAALPLHNSHDTSTLLLLRCTFPEELHCSGHAKPCNPRPMKDTPKKSYIFSLINSSSGHRGHSLPLLCSTWG